MPQLIRTFPDLHVHTPYPIQFGSRDWITVITNVTGTFTEEMTAAAVTPSAGCSDRSP